MIVWNNRNYLYVENMNDLHVNGESSKIKSSTNQKKIDETMKSVQKVYKGKKADSQIIEFALEAAVTFAQNQLNKQNEDMNEKGIKEPSDN